MRDALADRIAKGEWRPGTSIPNEGELAREFGVSPGTMRKALDLMEGERLVTRRQGRGTFVNDQASDELAIRFSNIRGADGERIVPQVEAGGDRGRQSQRIGVRRACDCARTIRSTAFAGFNSTPDQPFMVEEAAHAGDAVSRGLGEKNGSPHRSWPGTTARNFAGQGGGAHFDRPGLSGSQQRPWALRRRAPVLALDRVMLTLDGRPVEWRVGQCNLLAHHYLAEIADQPRDVLTAWRGWVTI